MSAFQLVQTDRSRRAFREMIERMESETARIALRDLCDKEVLLGADIDRVCELVPPTFPALFALLFEFRRVREPDYKASDAFRAKTERLRARLAEREYQNLVQSVDPAQGYGTTPLLASFGADMRSMNRQLGTIINFVITVVGGFFFGFTGVTYAYPSHQFDLATRFLLGLVIATVIFFADLYFVVKNMDSELEARPIAAKSHPLDFKKLKEAGVAQDLSVPKSKKQKKND